jgi:hypothetical protein
VFSLNCGDGVRCTASLNLSAIASLPAPQLPSAVVFEWTGTPTRKHWRPYFAWVQTVWQVVADMSQKRILHVMSPPKGKPVVVAYIPGAPPQHVSP